MARRVRRNVHECPADIKSHSVACLEFFRDMVHVLKCRAQANTTKHTLTQQASVRFLLCVDSHIGSSAQCGVLVCSVCLAAQSHVTLCTAAHSVLYVCRVRQARNATRLCPVMPVLCWHPSAIFPARTRHQQPEAKSAAGVASCQKQSSWQHSGEATF